MLSYSKLARNQATHDAVVAAEEVRRSEAKVKRDQAFVGVCTAKKSVPSEQPRRLVIVISSSRRFVVVVNVVTCTRALHNNEQRTTTNERCKQRLTIDERVLYHN